MKVANNLDKIYVGLRVKDTTFPTYTGIITSITKSEIIIKSDNSLISYYPIEYKHLHIVDKEFILKYTRLEKLKRILE